MKKLRNAHGILFDWDENQATFPHMTTVEVDDTGSITADNEGNIIEAIAEVVVEPVAIEAPVEPVEPVVTESVATKPVPKKKAPKKKAPKKKAAPVADEFNVDDL